jgi:hypothetical protein
VYRYAFADCGIAAIAFDSLFIRFAIAANYRTIAAESSCNRRASTIAALSQILQNRFEILRDYCAIVAQTLRNLCDLQSNYNRFNLLLHSASF